MQTVTQPVHTQYDSFDVPEAQVHSSILQAERLLKSKAKITSYYYIIARTLTEVVGVESKDALLLLDAAEWRLIQVITNLATISARARAKHNTKATKPVDLYRRYSTALRTIMGRQGAYARDAQETLMELYLEQTQSENELENPAYLDGYTGDPIAPEDVDIKVPDMANLPLQAQAHTAAADLGWDNDTFNQFVAAQSGGFEETDEEIADDDRGYVPPTLTQDYVIDAALQAESWKYVSAFNMARSEIFARMNMNTKVEKMFNFDKRDINPNRYQLFRELFSATPAFMDMVECVARIAEEDAITGAAVFLKVEGDYGVTLENITDIRVHEEAYSFLVDFLEMNGESIAELVHDSVPSPMSETEVAPMIELLEMGTQSELMRIMPKYDVNPTLTSSWNIAYTNAMSVGATMDEAQSSAWSAWRVVMSPAGELAYNVTLASTNNRKSAMAAFWKKCGPEVPRPRSKVTGIQANGSGLTLDSGRIISWSVAIMKVKGNEIDLSGDIRTRLADTLAGMNFGTQFVALLRQ